MKDERAKIEEELDDLKQEFENFKEEKERIRAIVGRIGGVPKFNPKFFNILFIVAIVFCLATSLVSSGTLRLAMLEVAIAALSAKIIYLIVNQNKITHFQLWILTSLEWRLNEILKKIKTLQVKSNPNE
ncbi:hypothetical protein ACFL0P_00340 [Candidatus Omnitrophota bacterium]